MKHRIETNIPVTANVEVNNCLHAVCRRLGYSQFGTSIDIDDNFKDKLVLIVKGNGAVLRDVCFALDVLGALD